MLLKSKTTSYGLVELKQEGSRYVLYVNGQIKSQSADLAFMMREYEKQ